MKKLMLMAAVAAFVLGIVGCNKADENAPADNAAPPTNAPVDNAPMGGAPTGG